MKYQCILTQTTDTTNKEGKIMYIATLVGLDADKIYWNK